MLQALFVNADGSWQTTIGPFGLVANNAAYSIVVSCPGQGTITLSDVLIGDVWLCTGQSNMAYSLNVIGVTNLPFLVKVKDRLSEKQRYNRNNICGQPHVCVDDT